MIALLGFFKGVFWALSNIHDGAFCNNTWQFLTAIFVKHYIIDARQYHKYSSFVNNLPTSQIFYVRKIFQKTIISYLLIHTRKFYVRT